MPSSARLLTVAALLALTTCTRAGRIEGTVVDVDQTVGRVGAFTVDAQDGPIRIRVDHEVDYGFDLLHLEDHRADEQPVAVEYEERDGEPFALRIEDA